MLFKKSMIERCDYHMLCEAEDLMKWLFQKHFGGEIC